MKRSRWALLQHLLVTQPVVRLWCHGDRFAPNRFPRALFFKQKKRHIKVCAVKTTSFESWVENASNMQTCSGAVVVVGVYPRHGDDRTGCSDGSQRGVVAHTRRALPKGRASCWGIACSDHVHPPLVFGQLRGGIKVSHADGHTTRASLPARPPSFASFPHCCCPAAVSYNVQ